MNEKNIRLVTAESVRAGHPDKFCDQVADAILDAHLRQDPNARVAVEVFATAGKIIVGGEVTSKATVSCDKIVAGVINRIGYTMSDLCGDPHELLELEVCLHEQSPDISAAVGKDELGAGDQGIMVGYATNETEEYLPLPVVLAHRICKRLDELKPENPWLGADGKAQVTVAYENDVPVAVTAVVVSLQHDAEIDHKSIHRFIGKEVLGKVLPRELLKEDTSILVNPFREIRAGRPCCGHRTDRAKAGGRSVWSCCAYRRRCAFGQRPDEGRPFRRVCRPLGCEEHRGGGHGEALRGADRLRHRKERTRQRDGGQLWHRRDLRQPHRGGGKSGF